MEGEGLVSVNTALVPQDAVPCVLPVFPVLRFSTTTLRFSYESATLC